jgi:IS30 family transposase
MAILTEGLKQQIRDLRSRGATYAEIEKELGVNSCNINRALDPERVKRNVVEGARRHRIKSKMVAKGQDFYAWQEKLGEHQ